ncbi:butyrophilin-like protein 2 [Stegastes partitus]|uniref:Butyrophilin-like protein 2 n=1 Tax=Stegastes partitus TaxID=144197 RepID=A0A9Y4NTL0_9TELE|nr:PREDICTED: butyrophilin-like protein 2 [Stegastes partitus]
MFVLVACCLLLALSVSDGTLVHDINATVGDSALLQCSANMYPTELRNLRFYWQDDRNVVLYSFKEGRAMAEHANELYLHRITAFPQDMKTGNVSVKLKNLTLEDNGRIFQAFVAVSESGGMRRQRLICESNLHVAVPYKNVSLALNFETMTAVCTTKRGFPEPLVQWMLHFSNNSYNIIDSKDTHNTAMQDPHDSLYSFNSTIHIPEGPYHSVTCLSHNPTIRMTLNTTWILNKGAAMWSLHVWAEGLIVAVLLLA